MKKCHFILINLLSVIFLIVGCTAQTQLANYQPKSAEEKEIVTFFAECDEAYQERNFPKHLECFHDDAKIKIVSAGADYQHSVVSKLHYKNYLESGRDRDMLRSGIVNPEIAIAGDSAKIKFQHREGNASIHETLDLKKEIINGKLYIRTGQRTFEI